MDRHWREVEAVNEYGQLLDRNHLLGLYAALYLSRNIRDFIKNFVSHIVDNHVGQKFLVNYLSLELALEEGKEHFTEFLNRDQTFLIFNHFIKLLL